MAQGDVLLVFREAVWMILKLVSPLLLTSMLLGLLISIFQAATQIHEQTITFVPKLFAIAIILIVAGSRMITHLTEFSHAIIGARTVVVVV